jgi:hypothetical protein
VHRVILPPPQLRPLSPRRHGDAGAPFTFGLGTSFVWRRDPGYAYVAERDRTSEFELFGSYDVFAPSSRLVIAAGASYRHFGGTGDQALELTQHLVQADLFARYVLLSWLTPYVRAAAGLVTSRVQVGEGSAFDFDERDSAFAATLGGGFTLRTPARLFESRRGHLAALGFGIATEAGFTFAPAAELAAKSTRDHGLVQAPLSLGSLERKAPYLRIAAVIRF